MLSAPRRDEAVHVRSLWHVTAVLRGIPSFVPPSYRFCSLVSFRFAAAVFAAGHRESAGGESGGTEDEYRRGHEEIHRTICAKPAGAFSPDPRDYSPVS